MAAVAVSADGQRIVSVDQAGVARVWEASSGRPLAVFDGHTRDPNADDRLIHAVTISPARRRPYSWSDPAELATAAGGRDGARFLLDISSGRLLARATSTCLLPRPEADR